MDRDILLLLVGGGIAIASSLLTTLATTVLNHYLQRKSRVADLHQRFMNLTGQMLASGAYHNLDMDNMVGTTKIFEERFKDLSTDVMIGWLEYHMTMMETQQLKTDRVDDN